MSVGRSEVLEQLGVQQYHSRSLTVAETSAPPKVLLGKGAALAALTSEESQNRSLEARLKKGNTSTANPPVEANVQQKSAVFEVEKRGQVQQFTLYLWRTEKMWVMNFLSKQPQEAESNAMHRLVNNVLMAVHKKDFKGVELHQYQWPMNNIAADEQSAKEWMSSLFQGRQQFWEQHKMLDNAKLMPLWLMHDASAFIPFDMPLSLDQMAQKNLPELGVCCFKTPNLSEILQDHSSKKRIWSLLKNIL